MIRGRKTWAAKRQNIVFPFFSRTTMARQGGDGVFRKNTTAPFARGRRSCIFSPRPPLPSCSFSRCEKEGSGCLPENFHTKTMHGSEIFDHSNEKYNMHLLTLYYTVLFNYQNINEVHHNVDTYHI